MSFSPGFGTEVPEAEAAKAEDVALGDRPALALTFDFEGIE